MVTLLFVLVLLAVVAIATKGSTSGPLDVLERLYVAASPLPAILALLLPGFVSEFSRNADAARAWGLRLNAAGGWLSLLLTGIGVVLLIRRSGRESGWDSRLIAGLATAALPAALIALVGLMYAVLG